MDTIGRNPRDRATPKRRWKVSATACVTVFAAATMLLAACSDGPVTSPGSSGSAESAPRAVITAGPTSNDWAVSRPVTVSVSNGTLRVSTLLTPDGRSVEGVMTPDRKNWKTTEPLGYSKSYRLHVEAVNTDSVPTVSDSVVSTVSPRNQTAVSVNDINGNSIVDGAKYGVGNIIVAHFDEPIADRAAAERALTVTTSPALVGSWRWIDDQNAHWRPRSYYPPGTRVSVSANIYGRDLGGGIFGQDDVRTGFVIGDSHVSVSDDATKTVTVRSNGRVVREMPTSMGMGGTEVVGGQEISFWTPSGTYTVMGKQNPVIMDSSTFGLPVNSRLGYRETINWATRISPDGIYLHQLDSTVWAQGNTNTSHGCLNLSGELARWFYDFSMVGDIVQIVGTGGPGQDPANNGDWTIPWEEWT